MHTYIKRVEIEDFFVLKGEFTADFCPGVNVLIGGNGTGKTTLLRIMYGLPIVRDLDGKPLKTDVHYSNGKISKIVCDDTKQPPICFRDDPLINCVYIPEKDILEHARGLLAFIEQKKTGFSSIYRDILIAAQDVPTQKQSEMQKSIGEKISAIIGGEVYWDIGDGSFYTLRTDGNRIPFVNEASGYRKLGLFGLLISSGRFEPGTILFWDEPENSLNPELMSILVDILLKLAKNGVQIFIATHSYNIARYFDVRKDKSIPVLFHNMARSENGKIVYCSETEYMKLLDNLLESASAGLFEAVVADAMGVQRDE